MQDLMTTPLCQIAHSDNMIATHRKFFSTNFCLKCRQVPGRCECVNPQFSNPTPKKVVKNNASEEAD